MWYKFENCWKKSRVIYILPCIVYYQDSGFVEDKSLTFSWLCFEFEVGLTIDRN